MQLPSESFFGVNRAVWLRNPILMRSFIISHFCLCALSEKKLFCLLSPFQKYNGKPTRTAEVHICPPTPLSLSLFLSLFDSLSFRLEASSICFDPHLFFSYPESIQIQTIRMIGTFPMPLKTSVSCSKSAEILVNWK